MEGSRYQLFVELEKSALLPLPKTPYEFATWKSAKVNIDYHVEVKNCYYSVPNRLVKKKVDVRLTKTVVEIFHNASRVASHPRLFKRGSEVGPSCQALVEKILETKTPPEQGFRSCLGIISLGKSYSNKLIAKSIAIPG